MELLVYAQDRTYSNSLSESKREEQEEKDDELQPVKCWSVLYSKDNHATLQELMLHLKSYYKVSFHLDRWFANNSSNSKIWPLVCFLPPLNNRSRLSTFLSPPRLPVSAWLTRSPWWSATRCCRSRPSSCRGRCCRCFRRKRIQSSCWRRISTLAPRGRLCKAASNASPRLAHTWSSSRQISQENSGSKIIAFFFL